MSIPAFVYLAGSAVAAAISIRWWYRECGDNIRAVDLVPLVLVTVVAVLFSWAFVLTVLACRYEDKVIFKKKKKE